MVRSLLTMALVLGTSVSAMGSLITVPLNFVPATSTINKLNLTLHATYSGSSDSDTSSTTVLAGSTAQLRMDYSFNPTTRQVNSVNSIEFTGGNFGLANTHFDLTFFIIYAVDVDATNVAGTFDTPTPPGTITGALTATFPTEQHNIVLNQGTIVVDSLLYSTSFTFGSPPVNTTTVGTGTITTALSSFVGGIASYNVEMLLPVNFDEDLPTGDPNFTARLEGVGTFKATGSFSVGNLAPEAYNDPMAGNESYYQGNEDNPITVAVGQGVLVNDLDSEPLQAVQPSDPPHGSVALNSNGSFTYTPDLNYHGPDSFTYRAFDGSLYSNTATVNLDVISVNDAPDAVEDFYWMNPENTVLSVPAVTGLLANDDDVENDPLTASKASNPAKGTVTVGSNGYITYFAGAGYDGSDSFKYKAFDAMDYSAETLVTIMTKIPGDANTDGTVDDTDAAILASHWGASASLGSSWALGDFDRDGFVGPKDASIMAANWGYSVELPGGEAGSAVPEPSAIVLLLGALLGLALRRR